MNSDLAYALDAALSVLNRRVLTLLALAMVFGLFCWAMARGDWVSFAVAGAFGITIFLPILYQERAKEVPRGESDS